MEDLNYIFNSPEEIEAFNKLQRVFPQQFQDFFADKRSHKCVVILPSLTLDPHLLSKIPGHIFYEERLLSMLMLLRMPNTHIIYLTSVPVDPLIIDYYLQFLPGITREHALRRLNIISCYDDSNISLTEKILQRPYLLKRLKKLIKQDSFAHLTCFNVTKYERSLAVKLGIPIYGCDPELEVLGNKSNSRILFREKGLLIPDGFENIYTGHQLSQCLSELKKRHPSLEKAIVKLNEGFSGEGNAVFRYEGLNEATLFEDILNQLSERLNPVATDISATTFLQSLEKMGGIVEEFILGEVKLTPSVQIRINPLGNCKVISTHDQIVGGYSDQVYLGASFPADKAYSNAIAEDALKIAEALKEKGVMGRLGIDFISVKNGRSWDNYAIEINLRKGGTTHPYILLQLLTDGDYDYKKGEYYSASNLKKFYLCTDNLSDPCFKGLTPQDLLDIAIENDIQYNSSTQEGVMFHLIGALSKYGKMGVVCVGSSHERAKFFYESTIETLRNCCQ